MVVLFFRRVDAVCFVYRMHPVAVFNAAFCVVRSLLIFVEDARHTHLGPDY